MCRFHHALQCEESNSETMVSRDDDDDMDDNRAGRSLK